jgi:hypothetical protein
LEKTRADFTITVDDLSAKLNGKFFVLKLNKNSNVKTFSINLATEKELAKTKITTGNLSTELKSKFHGESNFVEK